jgi:Icc-related predicted phosphoesterase
VSETSPGDCLRVAAAGDLHCAVGDDRRVAPALERLAGRADLLLLAGDLTTDGQPEQANVLARACGRLELPVFAVLGNHDWHAGRQDELVEVLREGGITVLEGQSATLAVRHTRVGIAGVKGFVGGFSGSHLPDFGEPLLREVYAETTREVEALEHALREVATCPVRLVVMHYSPTLQTLAGESPGIAAFLGSDRLAAPIVQYEPSLVVHGHAHGGTFAGSIGPTPVYNVAVPVMGRETWLFELDLTARGPLVH